MSFLQDHYNQIRKAGGSVIEHEIVNDLSKETMEKLESGYQASKLRRPKGRKGKKR